MHPGLESLQWLMGWILDPGIESKLSKPEGETESERDQVTCQGHRARIRMSML